MQQVPNILCVCGAPASGKTTSAQILSNLGWNTLEAGAVVEKMLMSAPVQTMTELEQAEYRLQARRLITGPSPQPLSLEILRHIAKLKPPIAISGIRNISTINDLKKCGLSLIIVFIDCFWDDRVSRFINRGGTKTGYITLVNDPIEKDWRAISVMADVNIDNSGTLADLEEQLSNINRHYRDACNRR